MGRKALDLTGKVFERLTVIKRNGSSESGDAIWECLCECQNLCFITGSNLNKSRTKSCGCFRKELLTTHGYGKDAERNPTYSAWLSMKQRCKNVKNSHFYNYGGRGISVHPTWLNSFENFLADVGECPGKDFSLDRIDNNGNYQPGNVRWATWTQQCNNQRKTNYLTLNNLRLSLQEWAIKLNVNQATLSTRKRLGWSDEKTLTTPVKKYNKNIRTE